jgi:ERCC4-related helicase
MDQEMALILALMFGFVSGLVVGWVQGSAPQKANLQGLESDLVLLKAQKMVWESESVKAQMREKDLRMLLIRESGKVKELRSQLESVLDSVLEKVKE